MTQPRMDRILRAFCSTPWAIMPEKLEAIAEFLTLRASGVRFNVEEIKARVGEGQRPAPAQPQGIAVLPLYGVLLHRMYEVEQISGPGGTSTEAFARQFEAALADPGISAIVIDIDSPGGSATGTEEVAAKIAAARGEKPIIAVANTLAASAAYYIASAADEIVVTPSGLVGSIGVYTVHLDTSAADQADGFKYTLVKAGKYKAEGMPFEPLSAEAEAAMQEMVDDYYAAFVKAVATNREVTIDAVTGGFGEGRVVTARKAVKLGMADRVATIDQVIAKLGGKSSGARARERMVAPRVAASADEPSRMLRAEDLLTDWVAAFGPGPIAPLAEPALAAVHEITGPAPPAAPPARTIVPVGDSPAAPATERNRKMIDETTTELTETREEALARLADIHSAHAKLSSWIVKGLQPDCKEVQDDIKANYQDRETKLRTGAAVGIVGADRETDRPFDSLGEQLLAVAAHYSPAGKFEGAGRTDQRLFAAASGASAGVGGDGGFLIQKDFAADLMKEGFESGVLASQCSDTEIGPNSDGLEVVYIDETSRATGSRWGGVRVYRVAEADTVTPSKAKVGKWECRLEDLMGLAYMTDRLIQDAPAMQSVFDEAFTEEFAFKLDDEIYRGTGSGECLGILKAEALVTQAKESGQAADTIVAENVQKMWSRVPLRSRLRGQWYYNIEAEPQLQGMQIGTGTSAQLIYMPPGGLSGQQYAALYGRPALPIEHASALGDVGDIAFLDLTKYKLIRKGGLQQAESIHVRFLYNERAFRWTARVNGAPKDKSAITPYKGTQTTSPFVALAAR